MSEKEDVHVRISGNIMEGVRQFAASNGISLAAAMGLLLKWGLQNTEVS
jgi:hypothetical protein